MPCFSSPRINVRVSKTGGFDEQTPQRTRGSDFGAYGWFSASIRLIAFARSAAGLCRLILATAAEAAAVAPQAGSRAASSQYGRVWSGLPGHDPQLLWTEDHH